MVEALSKLARQDDMRGNAMLRRILADLSDHPSMRRRRSRK